MDHRYQKVQWGPLGQRLRTARTYWLALRRWNKLDWMECQDCHWRGDFRSTIAAGTVHVCPLCEGDLENARQRVFVASLADVCDDHPSVDHSWRMELLDEVYDCQNLDFLFLTKRPQKFAEYYMPQNFIPDNLWVGTSVENQEWADKRIPDLVKIPAKVRFLSCEPLLGKIDLQLRGRNYRIGDQFVNWVICGGESGPKARPMHTDWVRLIRDQCLRSDVAFLFKQWGEWAPCLDRDTGEQRDDMVKLGKKKAGRMLDGVIYHQFPKVV